jgi:hypothetical protein
MKKRREVEESEMEPDAMERMNRALREAMKTPPKPRKGKGGGEAPKKKGRSGGRAS